MSLTRAAGSYRSEGALPLVHELLGAERVSLNTVTADNRPVSTQFDLRGLKAALSGYDFYCANSWLAANAPQPQPLPRFATTSVAPPPRLAAIGRTSGQERVWQSVEISVVGGS